MDPVHIINEFEDLNEDYDDKYGMRKWMSSPPRLK
jgi:hypothetical protein